MGNHSRGLGGNLPGFGPRTEAFPQYGIYAQIPQTPDQFDPSDYSPLPPFRVVVCQDLKGEAILDVLSDMCRRTPRPHVS